MKNNLIILLSLFLLTACSNNQKNVSSTDSISSTESVSNNNSLLDKPTELCFQHVEGIANKDTSIINLVLNNNQVSGTFNHIPYEKDSRKGIIQGMRNGDIIKAEWIFMQEGMSDTLPVEFKLSENELYQKTFGIDKNTGRQKLTDTSTFSIRYQKIYCLE